MSSSGPTRQRSFRDRLHGIGLSWHNKTQSVDCSHGYVNPLELVLDTSKKEDAGGRSSGGPLEPLLGPLAAAAATHHHHSASFHGGPSSVAGRRTAATSPGGPGRAMPPLPPAPQSAPPTTTAASSDAGRKQLSRTPTQPPSGAIEYVVKASDTLAGIAARFECTPGELTKMNRLTSRLIFPGQTLYIPIKEQESQAADVADLPEHGRLEDAKASVAHLGTGAGPPLPGERPGSPKAAASPPDSPVAFIEQHRHGGTSTEHIESAEPENKENMDMFLKISSRHITDGQGVVSGTLLVTPNNVMFIPNVSDALVMEHGSEWYEVTAPMDMVVAAALYNDITHMRLRDTVDPASGVQLEEPYRPADYQPPAKDQDSQSSLEPAKSLQECGAEVSPVPSMQDASEKPCSELSHSAVALESAPDQVASTEGKVIITSPPKTPEEGTPSIGHANNKIPEPEAETENKVAASVLSDVSISECKPSKDVQDMASPNAVMKSNNLEQIQEQVVNQNVHLGSDMQKPESTEQSKAQFESKEKHTSEKPVHCEAQKEICTVQAKENSGLEAMSTLPGEAQSGVGRAASKQLSADAPASEAHDETGKELEKVCKQLEAAAGEGGIREPNNVVPRGTRLEVGLSSATAQVVKDDWAGDKSVTKDIAAVTNTQDKLPTDVATPQNKILGMEESAAARKKERQTAEQYLFKPIDKASESPPTLRREPENGGRREKAFTPPPPSSAKSLPEPGRWARMLSPTLKLDSASDVPAPEPRSAASTESITLRMREWASAEGGISSDRSQESAHERVLKRLSNPMESISSYTHSISKMIVSSPKSLADFVRGADDPVPSTPPPQLPMQQPTADEKRPSSRAENANVWLKNMVEEKPELFAAFEKLGFFFDDNELVPRPAQSSEATLLYLCLRMGRPLHKKVQCSATASSKRRIRPQYWFGIPRNRADELYHFLEKWAPSVYGDVHRVDMASRGFELLPEPSEEEELEMLTALGLIAGTTSSGEEGRDTPDMSGSNKGHHGSKKGHGGALRFFKLFDSGTTQLEAAAVSPGDWEVVSMSETEARRQSSIDLTDLPLPELLDSTEIFTEEHRRELCKHLPARAESYSWALVYSTLKHGFSLKTLYREMLKIESPILLAVLDTEGAVFGVLTSCSLRMSDYFYGTGESFLFTFHPEFKLYKWTGENGYFIKGNADSLAFGAGDGQFGLWLDGDLFHGRSRRCKTYENDVLSTKEDFVVKAIEAWGFV
nr:LOW QUALITY PROTEIN: oxidation resistance protein 1-like [Rhipicephalus microplus]